MRHSLRRPRCDALGSPGRRLVYILEDASGSEGGGGGAVFLDPATAPSPRPLPATAAELFAPDPDSALAAPLAAPHWAFDPFPTDVQQQHSTFQEGLNANRNLLRAARLGFLAVVEVLDNSAWVFLARSGASSNASLQGLLRDRAEILSSNPRIRVYPVWQSRDRGWLADAISKLPLPYPQPFPSSLGGTRTGAALPAGSQQSPLSGGEWAKQAMTRLGFATHGLLAAATRLS